MKNIHKRAKITTTEEEANDLYRRMQGDRLTAGRPFENVYNEVKERRERTREWALEIIPPEFEDAALPDFGYLGDEISALLQELLSGDEDRAIFPGILISGPTGSGKTRAMWAIYKYVIEQDPMKGRCLFSYGDLIQELREEFAGGFNREAGSLWNSLTANDSGLLLLDDIGSLKMTEFEVEKLYMLIDKRTAWLLPTVMTTNMVNEKQFSSRFGDRITSRLRLFKKITFPNADFRDQE